MDRESEKPEAPKPFCITDTAFRESAIRTITAKNRLRGQVEDLRRSLHERPDDERADEWRETLARLEPESAEAVRQVEALKEERRRRDGEYAEHVFEYRLSSIPKSRREEARSLLLREREALREMRKRWSIDREQVGGVGVPVLKLEARLEEAHLQGDEMEIERWTALLETALIQKTKREAIGLRYRAEKGAIRADFAEHLSRLTEA